MNRTTHSVIETENFAEEIATLLHAPAVVCLYGNLGAGKTAFARGFARHFGIERGISSPTFTIMHRYEGSEIINHFDLYRIADIDELYDIGFDEAIESGISLIEWPDNFASVIPSDAYYVRISHGEAEDDRIIETNIGEV